MAQYQIRDPEEYVECPYDGARMPAKRLQYHLMKCRKNYVGTAFEICPFNATHHVPKPEFRHHVINCQDKAIIEQEIIYADRKENGNSNQLKGCTDTPVYQEIEIASEEDWDSELTGGSIRVGPAYDNTYYDMIRFKDLSGMTKSQKAVMNDNRLSVKQKMNELNGVADYDVCNGDNLRLPNTRSHSAIAVPRPQPMKQPAHHGVYTFSIGRGQAQKQVANGIDAPALASNDTQQIFTPVMPCGRGIGRGYMQGGVGRGILPPGRGRGYVAPPPGFCVPNVNNPSRGLIVNSD